MTDLTGALERIKELEADNKRLREELEFADHSFALQTKRLHKIKEEHQ